MSPDYEERWVSPDDITLRVRADGWVEFHHHLPACGPAVAEQIVPQWTQEEIGDEPLFASQTDPTFDGCGCGRPTESDHAKEWFYRPACPLTWQRESKWLNWNESRLALLKVSLVVIGGAIVGMWVAAMAIAGRVH